MSRGIIAFRKYAVLGLALAAPLVGVGCGNCNTVRTSACSGYIAAPAPCAPVAAPVQSVVAARPAQQVVVYAAPSAQVQMPVQGYVPADSSSVVYKPVPSRSYAAALSNIDTGDTKVIRTSSAGSSLVSSVVTASELAAAGIEYPAASAAGQTVVASSSYPVADGALLAESFLPAANYPAGSYVVADAPNARAVAPAARRHPTRSRRPAHRRGMPVDTVTASAPAAAGIPTGTPVYITPGGTPVSAYVPAPASGTYLEDAAPTGYLPVTERRGPPNAVVHYSTRSICKYDPARGEDCVWTSGF